MKQKHLTLAALAILCGTALFSCSRDDNESPKAPTTFHMTVNATKGTNNALQAPAVSPTRALSLKGSTLYATWSTTEQVFVQAVTQERTLFWFGGHLSPQSDGVSTTLSGTISLTSSWASSFEDVFGTSVEPYFNFNLQFPRKDWEYTGQVGTLSDIAQKYDYAIANAQVTIDGNKITGVKQTETFENQQAIVKFTLKDSSGNLIDASALTISATGLAQSVSLWYNSERHRYEPYNIPENDPGSITISLSPATSEVYAALRGINNTTVTLTATVGSDTYTYTRSGVTFEHGEYYDISVKMTKQ